MATAVTVGRRIGLVDIVAFARRILFDVRETESLRGYHLVAAATLMAPRLAGFRLYALTSGHPEEKIAMDVFRFDTTLNLEIWAPQSRHWLQRRAFDLFALISDTSPEDEETMKACNHSRRTLLGVCSPATPQQRRTHIVDGNDTRAFAAAALAAIGRRF
jgi:hypothetical protein